MFDVPGLGPEGALALIRLATVAHDEPDERLNPGMLEELWNSYLEPSVAALLPPYAIKEALRLLPRIFEPERARRWLEEFVHRIDDFRMRHDDFGGPWRRTFSVTTTLMAADAAARLHSSLAEKLISGVIQSHPRHVFAPWHDRPRRRERWTQTSIMPAWGEEHFRLALSLLPLAGDRAQAKRWLVDGVREFLLPTFAGAQSVPLAVLVDLARAVDQLGIDPQDLGMDNEDIRAAVSQASSSLQNLANRIGAPTSAPEDSIREEGPPFA